MNAKHTLQSGLLALLLLGSGMPAWSDQTADAWEKVVFHLDNSVNARWALMLAKSYRDDSPKAKIVIVVYGPGVDFLLEDAEDRRGNPYDPAVRDLAENGVEFRLCAETLNARKISREALLDEVTLVNSGIAEIARLQIKEGYAYLKP